MFKRLFFAGAVITAVFSGCKKETAGLNFDKFKDLELKSEFGVPLAVIDLRMDSLLKENDTLRYDPDGFIRYVIRKDSVASFGVDSFVNIPPLDPISINNKLGTIKIDDITTSDARTLGQLSSGFSSATQSALNAVAGTVSIFPAINDQNTTVNNLSLSSSQFSSVTMASGFLVVAFTNNLKVTVDQITLNLFNTSPFQTLIGQLVFRNVAPNSVQKDSLNLAGVTLSNSLGYSLPILKTFTSSSPVLVDLNDGLRFDVTTKSMEAAGGTAVFPSQTINPQDLDIDLKAEDTTVRIRDVAFETGAINYSIASNIDELLQIKVTIQGAIKSGGPMAPIIINVNNETKTGVIDLSGVKLDLTQISAQPYNKLKVSVEPSLISSNTLRNFDSSNYVDASFTFGTLKFSEVNGYMGNQTIDIKPTDVSFELPDQFNNGFPLDDPKIKLFTSNSIGVPVQVALDVEGTSKKGVTQKLNAPPLNIAYPLNTQKGQIITDTKIIDKNNSSIIAMLNLPPNKISFKGKATLNASGFQGTYNDFVLNSGGVAVGYEIEMPMSLKTNALNLESTTDNVFYDFEKDSLGKPILQVEHDQIEYVDLIMKIDNGLPFESSLSMFFADKDTIIRDSVVAGMFMQSAIPDANGRTIRNTTTVSTFRIPATKLKAMKEQKLKFMVVRLTIATFNNGSQPVKIYSDYMSRIGLSAKVKMKYKVSK